MGPWKRTEKTMLIVFLLILVLWATSEWNKLDANLVALIGIGVMLGGFPMFITIRTRKSLGEVRQRFEEASAEHKFAVLGSHDVGERLRAKGLPFERKFYVYEV